METLYYYYDAIATIKEDAAVDELLLAFTHDHQFVYYWYLHQDNNHLRGKKLTHYSTYPKDFQEDYLRNNRVNDDPVVYYGMQDQAPRYWHEMFDKKTIYRRNLCQSVGLGR